MTQGCSVNTIYQDFIQREKNWFQSLSKVARDIITDRGRVPDSELALYGEVGFLLTGLKPSVLIEHIPRQHNILSTYIDEVCQPWQKQWFPSEEFESSSPELNSIKTISIRGFIIEHDIQSPEISLQGCYLLTNTLHESYNIITKNLLDPNIASVKEDILALILDYPGSLPNSPDQFSSMVKVGYLDSKTGFWLTTYAGQTSQLPAIHAHFKLYSQQVLSQLNVELQLDIETLG